MNYRLLSIISLFCAGVSLSAQNFPYQNPNLSAKERAVDLCSRLTLEEKAQLMLDESPAIPRLGIKKFFWWSEALHGAANGQHRVPCPVQPPYVRPGWRGHEDAQPLSMDAEREHLP